MRDQRSTRPSSCSVAMYRNSAAVSFGLHSQRSLPLPKTSNPEFHRQRKRTAQLKGCAVAAQDTMALHELLADGVRELSADVICLLRAYQQNDSDRTISHG